MVHALRTLILAMPVVLAAAASCTESLPEVNPGNEKADAVYLKIGSVSTSELTKSAIEGASFPTAEAASIGLFIDGEGYTGTKYSNVRYTKPEGSDSWAADPEIELQAAEATVYGYYPYSEDVTSISSISVSSSVDGDDWMWATPVTGVSSSNPDVSLSMNHALAFVEVTFNITGYAEGAEMTALTLTAGSFAQAGSLDATDGTVTTEGNATAGCQLLADNQTLAIKDGKIIAKCLLVPTGLDGRQDMTIACTLDGKNLKATLSGDNKGVIVKSGTKSTVSLNIKGTTMEVAEVGVSGWNDGATTAIVGGHTVTVTGNVPAEISAALDITADDESVEKASQTATIRYDKSVLNDGVCELVYSVEPASCRIDHNAAAGILTVSDVTKDIEIALSTKVADWDEIPVISGIFTVDGSGRKVRFSTGLLYWDGDSFEIESGQLSFSGYFDMSHISHFFWSKDPAVSCQNSYSDSETSADDVLFTNSTVTAANPDFTAGELKGLWRALSNAEWNYLINTRVVNGGTGEGHTCVKATINERPGLIIFCDGYTGATENLTSIPEGCAFLPICGYRRDGLVMSVNLYGYCWSSTADDGTQAYCVSFRYEVMASLANGRKWGSPIRLVVDVTE